MHRYLVPKHTPDSVTIGEAIPEHIPKRPMFTPASAARGMGDAVLARLTPQMRPIRLKSNLIDYTSVDGDRAEIGYTVV